MGCRLWVRYLRNILIAKVCSNSNALTMELVRYRAKYRKVSNIRRNLVGNKIVDHSDVVGASPVGAAPTTSSFST